MSNPARITREEHKAQIEEATSNFGVVKTHFICQRPDIRCYGTEHSCAGCDYFEFCLVPDKKVR